MVINQIHNSEQQSPFSPKDDESESSIYSSPSRNYMVKRIISSSQKLMLYGLATMSLSFYEWMDQLVYRGKRISLMVTLQILERNRKERKGDGGGCSVNRGNRSDL